jgi:hypothetical protein
MSYSIYIGEPEIEYYPEDEYMRIKVKCVEHPNAPELFYGDISGKTNGRHPGYSQMRNWCEKVGLYELFYDEEYGLLRSHPGCRPLLQKHLDEVVKARVLWEIGHTNCKNMLPLIERQPEGYKDLSWQEQKKLILIMIGIMRDLFGMNFGWIGL